MEKLLVYGLELKEIMIFNNIYKRFRVSGFGLRVELIDC